MSVNHYLTPSRLFDLEKLVIDCGIVFDNMEDKLLSMCRTEQGRAFCKKTFHPPSVVTNYSGRPDGSSKGAYLMEVKGEGNFTPYFNYATSTTTSATANVSSMLFLVTPSPYVGAYCFMPNGTTASGWSQPITIAQSGNVQNQTQLTNVSNPSVNCNGYNFNNLVADASLYRPTYKSATFYLNSTAINDQGTVTVAKFKPSYLNTTGLLLLNQVKHDPAALDNYFQAFEGGRRLYEQTSRYPPNCDIEVVDAAREKKSLALLEFKRGKLSEDELMAIISKVDAIDVNAGSQADFYIQFIEMPQGGLNPVTQFATTGCYSVSTGPGFTSFPNNAGDVFNYSPAAVSHTAKEGAFVVLEPIDQTLPWINITKDYAVVQQSTQAFLPTVSALRVTGFNNLATVSNYYLPLFSANPGMPPTATTTPMLSYNNDVPFGGLDCAWVLFEGLTVPATSSITGNPYVTVKVYAGCEIAAAPKGSLANGMRCLPPLENCAIENLSILFNTRPDALPASANDLGSILGILSSIGKPVIQSAIKWLGNAFSGDDKPAPKKQQPQQTKVKTVYIKPSIPRSIVRNLDVNPPLPVVSGRNQLPVKMKPFKNNKPKNGMKKKAQRK